MERTGDHHVDATCVNRDRWRHTDVHDGERHFARTEELDRTIGIQVLSQLQAICNVLQAVHKFTHCLDCHRLRGTIVEHRRKHTTHLQIVYRLVVPRMCGESLAIERADGVCLVEDLRGLSDLDGVIWLEASIPVPGDDACLDGGAECLRVRRIDADIGEEFRESFLGIRGDVAEAVIVHVLWVDDFCDDLDKVCAAHRQCRNHVLTQDMFVLQVLHTPTEVLCEDGIRAVLRGYRSSEREEGECEESVAGSHERRGKKGIDRNKTISACTVFAL